MRKIKTNKNKMNLNAILSKVGLGGSVSQDVSALIIIGILSVVFGTVVGRQKSVPVLLSTYISMAIVSVLPADFLVDSYKLILFLVLIVLFTLSGKRFLSGSLAFGSKIWKLFVFSFLEIVFILSVIFSIIPQSIALGYVSFSAYGYFTSGWFPFIWLVAPLVFLLLFCRRSYSY